MSDASPPENPPLPDTPPENYSQQQEPFTSPPRKPPWIVTVSALLRKNAFLLRASKVSLIVMLILPALGVAFSKIIDRAIQRTYFQGNQNYQSDQDQNLLTKVTIVDDGSPLEACQWFDVYGIQTQKPTNECITLLFTAYSSSKTNNDNLIDTNVDEINRIMKEVAKESGVSFSPMNLASTAIPTPPFHQQIFGVNSLETIGEFLSQHPGRAAGLVVWQPKQGNKLQADTWYNTTGTTYSKLGNNQPATINRLRAALSRGVLKGVYGKDEVKVFIGSRSFDDIVESDSFVSTNDDYYDNYSDENTSVEADLVGIILSLVFMLSNVLLCSVYLAREKQEGLIGSLRVVGMTDSAYWTSWFIIAIGINLSSSLFAMILAYIIDASVLAQADFITPWVLLFVASICMYTYGTLAVGLVTQRRAIYGVQFIAILFVLISSLFGRFSSGTKSDTAGRFFLITSPGYHLSKVSTNIVTYNNLANGNENVTLSYSFTNLFDRIGKCNETILKVENRCEYIKLFDYPGCWKYIDCRSNEYFDKSYCAPDSCFYFPISDASSILIMIIQTLIAVVLTWYFFKVIPSGNGIHRKPWFLFSPRYWRRRLPVLSDSDLTNELSLTKDEQSVRVRGISKVFGTHKAVNDINLDMANGQVFVILGHNGAGKTTFINLLTGKISPSSGDAYIMGHSVMHDVESIQELVGSVPQHDILWSELSAYEHIRLFATIKGIARTDEVNSREAAITSILQKVHLEKESKQVAGGYSGGMKRRLSIALAGVGSPAILFMDEPTTGIDPLNRRRIWKLIQELKRGKVIVLTTHLMQEADSLGDYIAILDHGQVQAQGTPLNLKTEYGSGYTLSLLTNTDNVDRVCELAKQAIPDVRLVSSSAGSISIGISQESLNMVPKLTQDLQTEELIREWSVSQSTLEEVFLQLVKHDATPMDIRNVASNVAGTSLVPSLVEGEQTALENHVKDIMELPIEEEQVETTFVTEGVWILQIRSLLWKASILQRRSVVGTLVLFLTPIFGMLLLFFFAFDVRSLELYGNILIAPQTSIYKPQDDNCKFYWSLSAAIDRSIDPIRSFTTPKGFTDVFESGQLPTDVETPVVLEWSISTGSNVSLAFVEAAVLAAFREELKRADNSDDQEHADAECKDELCGPCTVDLTSWTAIVTNESTFSFFLHSDSPGYTYQFYDNIQRCSSSGISCPLNWVRFMLLRESFMMLLSEQLGTTVSMVSRPSYSYRNAFESLDSPVVTSSSNSFNSYCSTCEDVAKVLWLSGEGAAILATLAERLQGNKTEFIVKDQDVISLMHSNRQELENRKEPFGNTTYSACAALMLDDSYRYENNSDIQRGWIVNKGAPVFLFQESDWCNVTDGPVGAYNALFPELALQVSAFDVLSNDAKVSVVYLRDKVDLYYQNDGQYNIRDQRVFAVYCDTEYANETGTCPQGAQLSCSAVSSPVAQSCITFQESASLLVETTYNVIIGTGTILGGPLQINTQKVDNVGLSYTPALSTGDLAMIASLFALLIGMLMPTTISKIVAEKHQRHLFSMLLNGLELSNYWISTYIFHAAMCLIVVMFSIVFGIALRLAPFADLPYAYFTLVVLASIHAQFGFITLLSTFFSKERFAGILLSFGSIVLTGTALIMLTVVESLLNHWPGVISLLPMLGTARAFFLLFWNHYTNEVLEISGILFGSGTLYLIVGIYIHGSTGVGALWKPKFNCCKKSMSRGEMKENEVDIKDDKDDQMEEEGHDLDVLQEAIRALELSHEVTAIKIAHLGKTFPAHPAPKHAVVDLSMAMDYGEIFGLLGPNGAGKTTVISMLVGQLDPSQGAAYVAGFHSVDQRQQALKALGIVPQFDVLYPELSVKEHLQMYAGLKGVARKDNLTWALYIAKKVSLGGDLFDKPCKNLSGGMKRRLSIAIALLSNPKILFLDEPTTGLDPDMKRSIWDIVEQMREGRCIILTTHAMDEAEALCNRIGIMAQGSLKCIGTPSHLRQRYGSTFELTFTISQSTGDLDAFLNEYTDSAIRVSSYGQTRVYTMDKAHMDLTSLFTMILKGQDEGFYTEWGISNTTLDEVFCAITAESEGVLDNEY